MSGLLAVITRSTRRRLASKMRAIASLSSVRRRSILARASAEYSPSVRCEPGADLGRQVVGTTRPAFAELGLRCAIIPLIDHAAPMRGSFVSTPSTRHQAAVGDQLAGGLLEQLPHRSVRRWRRPSRPPRRPADPRSSSRCVPRPSSQPSTRARLSGSRASWPLHTSNQRAVSRTDRDTQPTTTVRLPYGAIGDRGMRPNVLFRPTRPQKPAGIRIDPPPSPPVASVTSPPATAAAVPPDDPPGVRAVLPRVVRRAVQHGPRDVDAAELRRRGLARPSTAPPRSRMRSTLTLVYAGAHGP